VPYQESPNTAGLLQPASATSEAETEKIVAQGQPGQIVVRPPSPKITRKNGLEVWLKL
jgi:hypothetical protein